jgi:hypothetical protein
VFSTGVRNFGELGGDVAGVEGVDEQKLSMSVEHRDGVGEEIEELVFERVGDRMIGDGGSKGTKRVGPGARTLLALHSGGQLSAVATRLTLDGKESILLLLGRIEGDVGSAGPKWGGAHGCACALQKSDAGYSTVVA